LPKAQACPICGVPVKPENLLRHVDSTHPRHPEAPALRETLRGKPGYSGRGKVSRPVRLKRIHLAVVAVVVLLGVSAYYVAPHLTRSGPIPCVTGTYVYHWHAQLYVNSAGVSYPIPANIGLTPGCAMPLHTHDGSGLIHVEPDVNRLYTIGDFFTIWGKSFGSPARMLVNGTETNPSTSVVLYDQESIILNYASFT